MCPNGAKVEIAVDDSAERARLTEEIERLTHYADAQERKVNELQHALESRVVIEQAVGMLAERFELTVADAFELLRRAARESRTELRTIARELTVSRATPGAIAAARSDA
jgi:AmiR/NasT family two-component response regulator